MHYDLPISQILRHELLECAPQTTVAEAAGRMHQARCGSILVVELGEVRGIWTERDALALNFSDPESIHLPVSRVMSTPVKTVRETDTVADAAIRFKQERLRHLLVVDRDGRRLGIVSQTDIVNHQGVEFYVHMRDVGSVLKSATLQVPGSMPVAEAVQRLREARADAAIVNHNGHLGILTGRDVLRLIGQESLNCSAGEVASFPLITVPRSSTLYHTRKIFNDRRIRHLGVMDEHGRITGLLSYADILDSVEQEYVAELRAALQEQSQRLQQSRHALLLASKVAESSQQAIMIVNAERIIQSINPASSAIPGYSVEEAVGQDTRLLKSGLHDADFYRQLYADLAAFGVWSGEIWNRRKNGELYPENLTITSVKGEGGQVINYVCVFTDMTEQKRARDDLKESHQRLEQQSSLTEMILDTLPVMVFVKDEDGRYLVMNEAAAAFVGHDKHEVVGRSDFELYPADVASRMRQDDIKALAKYVMTPLPEVPAWGMEQIKGSHLVVTDPATLPKAPPFKSDPLNLFTVVEGGDHHVTIMDGDRMEPLYRFQSRFALHGGAKYSPDGRFVYFASRDGWVSKVDMWTGKLMAEIRAGINTRNVAVSDDGRFLMVGNVLPHTLVALDARDLSPLQVIPVAGDGKTSRVSAVYTAPPRHSFVVALRDLQEVWEIPYADDAGPVMNGLVH